MKKTIKNSMKIILIALLIVMLWQGINYAANEKVQILETSSTEYMLYISEYEENTFEFAFSNNELEDKTKLKYKTAGKDTGASEAKFIAYLDTATGSIDISKKIYLWARALDGKYFVEAVEIDLGTAVKKENTTFVENITKTIKVDTNKTVETTEVIDGVTTTKTVGKVDVLEDGKFSYILVSVPNSGDYKEFFMMAEAIAEDKIENNMYSKLEVVSKFMSFYNKLVPTETSGEWKEVVEKTILQPEESENGDQYILWLKKEVADDQDIIDIQFLTCFEDYVPDYDREEIVHKLPVTYDNPVLFIILGVLVAIFIVVICLRAKTKKPSKARRSK